MAFFSFLNRLPLWGTRRAGPVVSVLRLSGPIGMSMGLGRSLSLAGLAGTIERAFSRRTKAVALVINSPGGSPVQSTLIFKRIRALAEEKNIPVFAFAEDVAASGGYMLALAGDEIYADTSSIIGSIGVISAGFGFHELITKIGIERRVYTAGESKSILDAFKPEDPEDVKRLQALQKEIHEAFKAMVKERRGDMLVGKDKDLFTGAFWTGAKAEKLGLIDGVGDLRAVMRKRFGDKVRLRLIEHGAVWWQKRLPFREDVGRLSRFARTGASWSDDLVETLERRTLWSRFGL